MSQYYLLFSICLTFFVCFFFSKETVIPICPPACGQNLFSVSVAASLGGVDIILPVLLIVCMFRRIFY
jgi:hypothetical protein